MLGDSINRIVKFYHKNLNEKISYAHLMCGSFGLVHSLSYIFSFGYKSVRLFGKNLSVWDFFLKVTMDFNQSLAHINSTTNSPTSSPKRSVPGSGASTLESPRRRIMMMDSPKKTSLNSPANAAAAGTGLSGTLSIANQFRK